MNLRTLVVLVVGVSGCAREREPAPTEMVDLARYLFRHWDEPELLPEATDNLKAWLGGQIDSDEARQGFELVPLDADDVAVVPHPDRPMAGLLGASGAARSPFPLEPHAEAVSLPDQVYSNPGTYDVYRRELGGEVDGFVAGDGVLRTTNDITTTTLGVTLQYILFKDYRWVEGEQSRTILARSWIEEPHCNDGGGTCLYQSYSVDLFFEQSTEETWRMTATWSELESPIPLGDDTLVASLAIGIQNVFRYTDEYLAGGAE